MTPTFYPHYWSTYCIHDLHRECRRTCKHCKLPCRCPCHPQPAHLVGEHGPEFRVTASTTIGELYDRDAEHRAKKGNQ